MWDMDVSWESCEKHTKRCLRYIELLHWQLTNSEMWFWWSVIWQYQHNMCRSWDRELISGRSSFSFPISFWTKNVSGCTRERDERIGNFIRTVPRSLNRNLLTNAAKYCWTMMVRCVCAVDELPSAIASTAQSSYAVNSGVFKMLTTRRRFAVMSWTHP